MRIAAALGTALKRGARVAASRESAPACRMIKRAMISGFTSAGLEVADLRVLPAAVARHLLKTEGYEAGFHHGNLDLHMARRTQDPHTIKAYKKSANAYRLEFGNRHEFGKGYGSGFEVGYLDASLGKDFRAATEVNRLSAYFDDSNQNERQAVHLDSYLDSGYLQGRRAGLNDARAKAEFKETESKCPDGAQSPQFCRAYQAGYRWGYSDGYSNQRPDLATQRASK